jgi:DNA-binding NarL/FixJ family response regulator
MQTKHRILLVEDHTLLRQGIMTMLLTEPDIEIAGEADNGRDAIRLAASLNPDLVLMDISMPGMNGTEAIADIKIRNPAIKVMMLTVHMAEEYIREALSSGADGYVLKHSTREELIQAIRQVLNGKTYLAPDVAQKVISGYLNGPANTPTDKLSLAWNSLTSREREIVKLVAEGNTSRYIAEYLYISVKTVEKHRSSLMKKLEMHNVAELTSYAIERGLVIL